MGNSKRMRGRLGLIWQCLFFVCNTLQTVGLMEKSKSWTDELLQQDPSWDFRVTLPCHERIRNRDNCCPEDCMAFRGHLPDSGASAVTSGDLHRRYRRTIMATRGRFNLGRQVTCMCIIYACFTSENGILALHSGICRDRKLVRPTLLYHVQMDDAKEFMHRLIWLYLDIKESTVLIFGNSVYQVILKIANPRSVS